MAHQDAITTGAEMVRNAFPDLTFVPDVVTSDGEYVTGRWTLTGTNTRNDGSVGYTAHRAAGHDAGQEIFRAVDGMVVEVWHQEDIPSMPTQLGLEPPPAIMRLAAERQRMAVPQGTAANKQTMTPALPANKERRARARRPTARRMRRRASGCWS